MIKYENKFAHRSTGRSIDRSFIDRSFIDPITIIFLAIRLEIALIKVVYNLRCETVYLNSKSKLTSFSIKIPIELMNILHASLTLSPLICKHIKNIVRLQWKPVSIQTQAITHTSSFILIFVIFESQ